MATRIGIRALRDTLTATLRRVRAGETFEVTHDGQPVALLAPLPADRIAWLIATGEVTEAEAPLEFPLRLHSPTTGVTASEALAEDRAER
jgi:antitoxin (DNA-binding transcriptional repressor) of toxin-antitoxin stability system